MRILVVEDGTEYTDAFHRLVAGESVEVVRAGECAEAARMLSEQHVDALFLDVVFDRVAPEKLAGDRSVDERRLAEHQGFYVLNELAPLLPDRIPVVIAYDFSAEPERLTALRATIWSNLSGVADGTPISAVFDELTSGGTRGDLP